MDRTPVVHDATLGAIAERIGCERMEAFAACAPPSVVRAYGLRWRRVGGVVQMACDRMHSLNRNRTQGLGVDEPLSPGLLDDVIAFHRAGPCDFMLNVPPFARPADHEALLRSRRLTWWRRRVLWMRDASPAPPVRTDLVVRALGPDDAALFGRVTVEAHGSPPEFGAWAEACVREGVFLAWLAWDGDQPVASATLSIGPSGAWFGAAATRESHRGRGAQSALIAARIDAAREAGVTRILVETVEALDRDEGTSSRNVERAGFTATHMRPSWVTERDEAEAPREA